MEFAYNENAHVSIEMNPFQIMYGQDCLTLVSWNVSTTQVETFDQMMNMMQLEQESIRDCMLKAQARAKTYANQVRSFRDLELGDMVFLKVTPKKSQLTLGKCYKLSLKYCEPFQILRKVGTMAYELKLPSEWKIHNVFHVNLSKKFVSDPNKLLQDLL